MGKIGFIGLGVMGKPMAINLLKAGFSLVVHNRSRGAVNDLKQLGAEEAWSSKEVASKADVIITSLPNSKEVTEVTLGVNGVIEAIHPKHVTIDTSTVEPATAIAIAQAFKTKEAVHLDAPMSGGPEGAAAAALTFMVGGDPSVLEEHLHIFRAMGKNIFHMGPSGSGQAAKLVNQILVGLGYVAVAEAWVWGAKAGVNMANLFKVLSVSAGDSYILRRSAPQILEGKFGPGFQTRLIAKDLGMVLKAARAWRVPMLLTAIADELYAASAAIGNEFQDAASVIKVLEKISNVSAAGKARS
ncbi:MAG: NAD(P)-dependent oxidoreductase [Candidatus Bathyarchaeia archaeon]